MLFRSMPTRDYRGVPVVGAWRWLPTLGFGIVTQLDAEEAYAPLQVLRLVFVILFQEDIRRALTSLVRSPLVFSPKDPASNQTIEEVLRACNVLSQRQLGALIVLEQEASLDRYVAASQVGITLSSLILGAYAQATAAVALAPWIAARFGLAGDHAQSIAVGTVLVALASVQITLGELIPKTLALQ